MATETLAGLLDTLKSSLEAAGGVLPSKEATVPPEHGISLFDTKNELFLSYLQNLVFLILFKLDQLKGGRSGLPEDGPRSDAWDQAVKRLVTTRVYLEKGVKPLENRLRYEIDRVLRAAEDAANAASAQANGVKKNKKDMKDKKTKARGSTQIGKSLEDGDLVAGSESSDNSAADSSDGSNDDDDDDDDDEDESEEDDAFGEDRSLPAPVQSLRPNMNALRVPDSATARASGRVQGSGSSGDGVYRPPKITPTAMPTSEQLREKRAAKSRGGVRSGMMDAYLAEELSGAPAAQPSVGSNIERAGRSVTSAAQRREAEERRAYEEANFVRLPAISKKERRERARRDGTGAAGGANGGLRDGFGGEDWRDLGAGAERVMRDLDRKRRLKASSTGGAGGALERSRSKNQKRSWDSVDGGGGGGNGSAATAFERKRRQMSKRQHK